MKSILYLDTTPDITEPPIIIKDIARHYGFSVDHHTYSDRETFEKYVKDASKPFGILYFASHGDPEGVRCNDQLGSAIADYSWPELGMLFCEAEGLNQNSTILLASCDAGFRRGALTLMANCDKINAVAGLPCKLEVRNEAIIFHTFLLHLCRDSSSDQIENAVSTASGQQFKMYKRFEMDVEISLFGSQLPQLCWHDWEQEENSEDAD